MDRPTPRLLGLVALGVALGGALGSVGRYAVETLLPFAPHAPVTGVSEAPATGAPVTGFPWATLLVNVSGALLMGVLVAWLTAHPSAPAWARPFAAVGLLGGWTTYSTFAAETEELWSAGAPGASTAYVLASVGCGLLAVVAGALVGQWIWPADRAEIDAEEVTEGA